LLPLSLILIKYFPAIGVDYTADGGQTMWIGVTTQKNVLGYLAMVCGLFCVNNLVVGWKKGWATARPIVDGILLIVALRLLAGWSSASSKTSLLGFGFGVIVLLMFHVSSVRAANVNSYLLATGLLTAVVVLTYASLHGSLFEVVGRDATLTGRTEIWELVLAIGPGN